ncbi:hypothetical protein FA95DRAFT_293806 [Auriscalpium vulgare]|uniref:Uncharacterized protein n=1 Tax=Auriscalpium vulgare TaxID=40419 RepID=A0ACB8RJ38_9AGAM|nr:hypothetical protein FA95DRAFT_293806 [Auriscalpium vulgare]
MQRGITGCGSGWVLMAIEQSHLGAVWSVPRAWWAPSELSKDHHKGAAIYCSCARDCRTRWSVIREAVPQEVHEADDVSEYVVMSVMRGRKLCGQGQTHGKESELLSRRPHARMKFALRHNTGEEKEEQLVSILGCQVGVQWRGYFLRMLVQPVLQLLVSFCGASPPVCRMLRQYPRVSLRCKTQGSSLTLSLARHRADFSPANDGYRSMEMCCQQEHHVGS